MNKFRAFLKELASYFSLTSELESQSDVELSIRSGVSFKGSQLIVLILAIFVASLGLNTDSIPVIIGAMLISPLMGPIMGIGLAIGIMDYALLRRSLKNISMAIAGSLIASCIFFLISPQYEGTSQLLARTSPSIYDVLIALFGGGAGFISTVCKNKGQVLPGVAIATSLMPPLCTAGYGLATMQMHFFLGALYLFFTNFIFIMFATWIGVKALRYQKVSRQDTRRSRRVQFIVTSIVTLTVVISAFLTFQMIRKNIFLAEAVNFVNTQMVFPNTQVLNHQEYIRNGKRHIDVTLIGQALPKDSLQLVMLNKLDSVGLGGTVLDIKQGFSMAVASQDKKIDDDRFYALMQARIAQGDQQIDSLKGVISNLSSYDRQSLLAAPELKVIFPSVKDIAISRVVAASTGEKATASTDTLDMVFVNVPGGLSKADRTKLKNYISVRFKDRDVHLVLNPEGFPWPSATASKGQ